MSINVRRKQLILGVNGGLRLYPLHDGVKDGKIFNDAEKVFIAKDHSDIVKGTLKKVAWNRPNFWYLTKIFTDYFISDQNFQS